MVEIKKADFSVSFFIFALLFGEDLVPREGLEPPRLRTRS